VINPFLTICSHNQCRGVCISLNISVLRIGRVVVLVLVMVVVVVVVVDCSSFNDAFTNSDYTASNKRVIGE
jgi:hypothetical protein